MDGYPIVVLGPWRSGTSAVAGALHTMGVSMGNNFHRIKQHHTYEDISLWHILHRHINEKEAVKGNVSVAIGLAQNLFAWSIDKTQVYGMKHPLLCFCIDTIENVWPTCRYVCVYRNLTDAALSLNETGWFKSNGEDAVTTAAEFRDKGLAKVPLQRIHSLRYEELMDDTASEIWELAEFVGCSDAAKMRAALTTIKPEMDHSRSRV